MSTRPTLLLVANWDSGVGYAWWLMESYWVVLAELYSRSHRAVVVFPSISKISSALQKADIDCLEVDFVSPDRLSPLELWRFLRKHQVDIVYFSDRETWSFHYLLCRLAGVRKIVVHDHTPGSRAPAKGWKRLLKSLLNRLPFVVADAAIGASEFVRHRLVETNCMPSERVYAVPNGIPEPELETPPDRGRIRDELGLPIDEPVLVTVARANRYKQIDFVIRCIASLADSGRKPPHFLFVGDGPDLDYFRELARNDGVQGYVTFAGRRDDVQRLLHVVDFAVHPSRGEVGYSLSILEYMQAGLPVVVPDNPSVCGATAHGVTGLVYDEGDVGSASDAIGKLTLDGSLRRDMGRRARAEVADRYRLEHTHATLVDAFMQIDPRLNAASGPDEPSSGHTSAV